MNKNCDKSFNHDLEVLETLGNQVRITWSDPAADLGGGKTLGYMIQLENVRNVALYANNHQGGPPISGKTWTNPSIMI